MKRKRIILLIVLLSYFVTAMDSSIVITGLVKIKDELNLSQSALSWIQNAYVLSFGGFILLGGRLSDVFGRKRILNLSLLFFGLGSALAGAAESDVVMILARLIQGVGASILAPTSLALIMDTFAGKERTKAVAWYSSISGLGSSIGLVMGGFLASFLSWRIGFYINIPLTLLMLVLSLKILSYDQMERRTFDFLGTVLSVPGIFSFVYAINGAEKPVIWLILSFVLLVVFLWVEKRSQTPLMPLVLFKSKIRSAAYLARTFYMCAMLGFWFYISEYLQGVLSFTPILTGVAFFPMTISLFLAAVMVPRMVDRMGNKCVLFIGILFLFIGFIWTLQLDENSGYLTNAIFPMILLGFGQGFSMSPMTNLGIYAAAQENAGAASGLVNVAHQIGGSIGLSIMVAVSGGTTMLVIEFHRAMIVGLVFIVLMALVSLIFPQKLDTGR